MINNPINPINSINSRNPRNLAILLLSAYCLVLTFTSGCASLQQKEKVLALVDGEAITKGDLEYSLSIAHRKEDLSSAGEMDLNQYVQKLVDDQLIIDDAGRMGMDEYPEVQQSVQAFLLRESVTKLYHDEIVQKVSVTESEVRDYYKKNYERFTLGIIEANSEEEAEEVLKQLKAGGDFKEIALQYSKHPSEKSGEEVVYPRNSLAAYIYEAIIELQPGGYTDVIHIMNNDIIVKFIQREEAPDDALDEALRGKIEKELRDKKEKERSDEYLKYLRERAQVKIDNELLSTISLNGSSEEIETWAKDERPLVDVDGSILTVGDFITNVMPGTRKSEEDIIQNWINRKIVDHEALNRHYESEPDLERKVYRYENQILKKTFIKRIVVPRVVITDKLLEDYYESHKESFKRPARYRIQRITVKDEETAQEIVGNLRDGADFSWVAKRKSIDSHAPSGGEAGWVKSEELPGPLGEMITTLNPGDITPGVEIDSLYIIVKLKEKTEEAIEEFEKVKNIVYRVYFNEQVGTIMDSYIDQLKQDAHITIYDEEIKSLEKMFQK